MQRSRQHEQRPFQSFDPSNGELLGEVNQTSAEESLKPLPKQSCTKSMASTLDERTSAEDRPSKPINNLISTKVLSAVTCSWNG